jgi:surface protein
MRSRSPLTDRTAQRVRSRIGVSSDGIPPDAILTESGEALLTESGELILQDSPSPSEEHLYLPEAGKVWVDTARTTLATPGDPVGSIQDQSESHYAEQGTTANKPTLKEDANGNRYLDFVANEDFLETTVTTTKATKVSTIPGVGAFSAEVEPGLKSRSKARIQSTTAGALVRTGTYSQFQRNQWATFLDQRGKDVADSVTSFKDYFRDEPLTSYDAHAQDTSSVTSMRRMFLRTSVSDLSPLSGWDTSSVTIMGRMFRTTNVSDLSPLSGWDTSNVTNMRFMFDRTSVSDLSPLSDWDTSNVTNMRGMFNRTNVSDLSPLSGWDTSQVTNMRAMFRNTSVSDPSTISGWDVGSVGDFTSFLEGAPLDDVPTGDMLDGWTDGSPNLASDLQSGVTLGIPNADYSQMDTGGQDAVNALCSNQNWTISATNAPADCS